MKGVIVSAPGGPYEVTDDLPRPSPSPTQVLVKSLVTGINPIETFMQSTGLFVLKWPIVLGCDASGVVVDVGSEVKDFKVGDHIFGCTRLGFQSHGTFQEFFLMDDKLTFKRPKNVGTEQAATLGVGTLTACMGLFEGLKMDFPEPGARKSFDEWVVILGGAGSIGQYAIQLAKICGYKVLASCSSRTEALVKKYHADATFDYKKPEEEQLEQIKSITGGKFGRVFDTVAKPADCPIKALQQCSKMEKKYFTSTDDWTPIDPVEGIEIHRIHLGPIGRTGELAKENPTINEDIASYIPKIVTLLEKGEITPNAYEVVGKTGFESVAEAIKIQLQGKGGGSKYVVRLQDE